LLVPERKASKLLLLLLLLLLMDSGMMLLLLEKKKGCGRMMTHWPQRTGVAAVASTPR
jgi:hypothetical protein